MISTQAFPSFACLFVCIGVLLDQLSECSCFITANFKVPTKILKDVAFNKPTISCWSTQGHRSLAAGSSLRMGAVVNEFWKAEEGPVSENQFFASQKFVRAEDPQQRVPLEEKPLLLYLPGVDGVGISAFTQFEDFARVFDFWRLTITSGDDRSNFDDLLSAVVEFVLAQDRGVILLGESFGGMLALGAAAKLNEYEQAHSKKLIRGVFCVNPATSFDTTIWTRLAPLLASLRGTSYTAAQLLWLVVTLPDLQQVLQTIAGGPVGLTSLLSPLRLVRGGAEGVISRALTILDKFQDISSKLSQESLRWRISNWLDSGVKYVNPQLPQIRSPVVVVAGSGDRLLPSKREAERLSQLIPECEVEVVNGAGHIPMFDQRFNMTDVIVNSYFMADIFPLPVQENEIFRKDFVTEFSKPTEEQIQKGYKRLEILLKIYSPQYFSTSQTGRTLKGTEGVPDQPTDRPILFVGNHQLYGVDTGMIVKGLLDGKGILARGLAHPFFWSDDDGGVMNNPLIYLDESVRESGSANAVVRDIFSEFGAVPVNPRNYYRLLDNNEAVLLYPGGVREIYHKKNELYKLFWPEQPDFIRMAIKFNALIVPFSAIGAAESFGLALDADELLRIPIVSQRLNAISNSIPSARLNDEETFVVPLAYPKPPPRCYIKFGKVFDTKGTDRKDQQACEALYKDIKKEVEDGIAYLLKARKSDPYNDPYKRVAYERLNGRQAPTFPLNQDY